MNLCTVTAVYNAKNVNNINERGMITNPKFGFTSIQLLLVAANLKVFNHPNRTHKLHEETHAPMQKTEAESLATGSRKWKQRKESGQD